MVCQTAIMQNNAILPLSLQLGVFKKEQNSKTAFVLNQIYEAWTLTQTAM